MIKESLIPLGFAWEEKLRKFDALFISRTVHFQAEKNAFQASGFNKSFENYFTKFVNSLPATHNIKRFNLAAHPRGLRNVDNGVSINAGEINVDFFQNAYEVTYTKNNKKINRLYHQKLTEKEISKIVNDLGNFLYNNVEQFIEANKKA